MNYLLVTPLSIDESGFVIFLIFVVPIIIGLIIMMKFFTLVQRVVFIHERLKMLHEDIKKLLPKETDEENKIS